MTTTKANNKPKTLDHLRSAKKPVFRNVWVALDDEMAAEYQEAVEKRNRLKTLVSLRPEDAQAAKDLNIAEQTLREIEAKFREEGAARFRFRSIGRVKFERLVKDHPPTAAEKQEVAEAGGDPSQLGWCVETFTVALVAACSVEPEMTVAEVRELWDDENWTQGEAASMFNACLEANSEHRQINLDAVGNGLRGM